jgi:hypothetical protein
VAGFWEEKGDVDREDAELGLDSVDLNEPALVIQNANKRPRRLCFIRDILAKRFPESRELTSERKLERRLMANSVIITALRAAPHCVSIVSRKESRPPLLLFFYGSSGEINKRLPSYS